jgi:predicted outer membrane repeat protein
MRGVLIGLMAASMSSFAIAADRHVPAEFATIQAAVDGASDGDRILIAPGTYNERVLSPAGKSLEIIGTDGPEVTIIDSRGLPPVSAFGPGGSALGINNTSSGNSSMPFVVEGLTLRGDQGSGLNFAHYGSGLFLRAVAGEVRNCIFEMNDTSAAMSSSFGGGLAILECPEALIIDCVFRDNDCTTGGASFIAGGDIEIIGCTFENNTATQGGAIRSDSELVVKDSVFRDNTADNGGALWGRIARVESSLFHSNTASAGVGGAMRVTLANGGSVVHSIFDGNESAGRGGVISSGVSLPLRGSIVLNTTSGAGGALDGTGGAFTVSNSILRGNNALVGSMPVGFSYCNIEGGAPGDGNIDADPMFVDALNGDYRLDTGSPCIDAGSNLLVERDVDDLNGNGIVTDGYPFDGAGNPRFTDDLFVPNTGQTLMIDYPVDMGPFERVVEVATDGNDDCNGNFINDLVDIVNGTETDLNSNLIPDSCDIASGVLTDANMDGIPDEYQNACLPDLNEDGNLNFLDVSLFLSLFSMGCP